MWTRTLWWKEENWPVPKKALERRKNTAVNGVCDEDNILLMTVNNCLQRIGSKPIKFENAPPPGRQEFLSKRQVKYVEDIIFTRYTANLGMSRKDMILMILLSIA